MIMMLTRIHTFRETSERGGGGMGSLLPAPSGCEDILQRGCVKSLRES